MDIFTIEKLNTSYYAEIIQLILSIQNNEFDLNLTIDDQPELLDIKRSFTDKGGDFWVALSADKKVIGTIALEILSQNIGILRKMFVLKEFRGIGLAQKLMNKLLEHAKENKINRILLDTPGVAKQSHKFYEKNGFKKVNKAHIPEEYSFPNRDSVLYELKIIF